MMVFELLNIVSVKVLLLPFVVLLCCMEIVNGIQVVEMFGQPITMQDALPMGSNLDG